jgi:dsDNA-specific endonuclease/ATPase MutS2
MEKATTISSEISLIGLRTDVALPGSRSTSTTRSQRSEYVRVVHGKGTGQMRKAVWEALKTDSRVAAYNLAHTGRRAVRA